MVRRLLLTFVVLAGLLVACGIPDSGKVTKIQDKDLRQLGDTIPTTAASTIPPTTIEPTTTTIAVDTPTTIATEEVTLYFISGNILVPLAGILPKHPSAGQVLSRLQDGPPADSTGSGLRTAVPTLKQAALAVTEDGSGVATIELPAGFFSQIPPEDQLLALGQIVLTITERGGIGQVLFVQNGQPIGVPRRGGGSSDGTTPLTRLDYEELLSPTAATTTTSTLAPVATVPAG
jgi:spore germination protein GerM